MIYLAVFITVLLVLAVMFGFFAVKWLFKIHRDIRAIRYSLRVIDYPRRRV